MKKKYKKIFDPIYFTLNYICPHTQTMVVLQKEQVSIFSDEYVGYLIVKQCPACLTEHELLDNI